MRRVSEVTYLGTLDPENPDYAALKGQVHEYERLVAVFDLLRDGEYVTRRRVGVPELTYDVFVYHAGQEGGRYRDVHFFSDLHPEGKTVNSYLAALAATV